MISSAVGLAFEKRGQLPPSSTKELTHLGVEQTRDPDFSTTHRFADLLKGEPCDGGQRPIWRGRRRTGRTFGELGVEEGLRGRGLEVVRKGVGRLTDLVREGEGGDDRCHWRGKVSDVGERTSWGTDL